MTHRTTCREVPRRSSVDFRAVVRDHHFTALVVYSEHNHIVSTYKHAKYKLREKQKSSVGLFLCCLFGQFVVFLLIDQDRKNIKRKV